MQSLFKSLYVRSVRLLGRVARRLGLLKFLETRTESRSALWLRSLFAIYDFDQLQALDLPWWSFGAIESLGKLIRERGTLRVFEYGAGASTVWLARRGCRVSSVEHDTDWYDTLIGAVRQFDNVDVSLVEPTDDADDLQYLSERSGWRNKSFRDYVDAIDRFDEPFDIIVIDGRARVRCLHKALTRLAPAGVILFDNALRKRYRAALQDPGLKVTMHKGLTASLPYPDATALVYPA